MIKHTLWFHIGMPKTGTSSIERFLFTNQKQINEIGLQLIDKGLVEGHGYMAWIDFF